MSLLAEIRAAGGTVNLLPDNQFQVVKVPPELRAELGANRESIAETLREESLFGIQYRDSAYWITVSNLYNAVRLMQSDAQHEEETERLLVICREIDDAMSLSIESGVSVLHRHRAEMERLADQILVRSGYMLTGTALHREMKTAFVDVNEDVLAA